MVFKKILNKNGFTMIELIVVIAILGILVAIAVPHFWGIIDNARIATDKANLRILNTATNLYGLTKTITNGDIFDGISTDEERMQVLVDNGYLNKLIKPQKKDAAFNWHIDSQEWLYSLYEVSSNSLQSYLFKNLSLDDFRKTGNWSINEDGFYSNYGLLFIDNNNSEYTISSKAQLEEGESGGYGILFETTLTGDNKDTGYVLQFDRGFGGIVIRKRTNGEESSPILRVTNSNNNLIPSNKRDSWWTEEHEIKLEVKNVPGQEGQKSLNVWIGENKIIENWVFESNIVPENNFTGFRSWHKGTTYKEMTIY